jgi:putative polymerase
VAAVLRTLSNAIAPERQRPALARLPAAGLVLSATLYAMVLCWLFSRGAPISVTVYTVTDGAVVVAALALALVCAPKMTALPVLAISLNFLLIAVLAQNADLKGVRDVLAIVAFLGLGFAAGDLAIARYTFFATSILVLGFGLFELIAPKPYADTFNVLRFYIMRGLVNPNVRDWADNSLFVSSMRGDARNLFPMFGPHRVSSIFLEPVSMGNFGAIALAWGLSLPRRNFATAATALIVGVVSIILADARFAALAAVVFVFARFIPTSWARYVLAPAPFVAVGLLLWCAGAFSHYGDNLTSRLASSGGVLAALSPAELFGFSHTVTMTLDSGYGYALSAFGLPCCVALWFAFVLTPTRSHDAERFKLLIGCYICMLLCVSGSSLFALKTGALLWYIFGTMAAQRDTIAARHAEPGQLARYRPKAFAA